MPGQAEIEQTAATRKVARRMPVGAEIQPDGGVHFRVWAPRCRALDVVIGEDESTTPLARDADGYFEGVVESAGPGTLYRFRLDGDRLLPDPVSRYQPEGPHGPSMVVDPDAFAWNDRAWKGVNLKGQVVYEMHLGTFTPEGTWDAAAEQLDELRDLGITLLEIMPVNEFAGSFGWGYDGVTLFAPYHVYGDPDAFRRFVDRAHSIGMGVILDVVYNHFGPDGAYQTAFADYFSHKHNEWGQSLNFDGPGCGPVREYFLANAGYWIDEFHLDGLRLDATQAIHDDSTEHFLAALSKHTRSRSNGRSIVLIAENDDQDSRLVRPLDQGGYGLDAVWNDDFHHTAQVALTRRAEGYYRDFHGNPQELISATKWGYLFQGQFHTFQKKCKGTPAFGLPSASFVTYLENHDQVANSARGDRLSRLTSPGLYKAMTTLLLLAPGTPMLFQGQEFAASNPFLYFADHGGELGSAVRKGRAESLTTFKSLSHPDFQNGFADPTDRSTFERSRLDFSERESNAPIYRMVKDLLKLRREDPIFSAQRGDRLEGAVLGNDAFLLRYFTPDFPEEDDSRLLLINLGRDLTLSTFTEPLLSPPTCRRWEVLWASESHAYGGTWAPPLEVDNAWHLPGQSAVVLAPTAPPDPECL